MPALEGRVRELERAMHAMVEIGWADQARINALEHALNLLVRHTATAVENPWQFVQDFVARARLGMANAPAADVDDPSKAERTRVMAHEAMEELLQSILMNSADLRPPSSGGSPNV